jgi:hypothetical protein
LTVECGDVPAAIHDITWDGATADERELMDKVRDCQRSA